MPTFRVYYDAVIHYAGVMEIEAPTEEAAHDIANTTLVPVDEIRPEHVTDCTITAIENEEETNDAPGTDADPGPEDDKEATSPTDAVYRQWAREDYGCDDIEIDDDARIAVANEGVWVAAWVWVPHGSTEEG